MPTPFDKLKRNAGNRKSKRDSPLWKGPETDGVTFSLLSRFLCCRERFRLLVVDGLKPVDTWNHKVFYGNMWHLCEDYHAQGKVWDGPLKAYRDFLFSKYPLSREQVQHWYDVCRVQFPIYVDYWSKHRDVVSRTPLLQEQVFDVPYSLPSGRVVRLRGKWDSVDLIGTGKTAGVYLQENKSKGQIDQGQLMRQLTFDLQTMMYMVALVNTAHPQNSTQPMNVQGVRYNVIRRPLSGGKGTIVQKQATAGAKCARCRGDGKVTSKTRFDVIERCPKCKGEGRTGGKPAETKEEFYSRLAEYIKDEPDTYFMRWTINISKGDIEKFRRTCLDPILENLCDWWEWVCYSKDPFQPNPHPEEDENIRLGLPYGLHYRFPYGVYNVTLEGGSSEVDEFLASGSTVGLQRTETLFRELE